MRKLNTISEPLPGENSSSAVCTREVEIHLQCPLDCGEIVSQDDHHRCVSCNNEFPLVDVGGRLVTDFRCLEQSSEVTLTFKIPQTPLATNRVDDFGHASEIDFKCASREEIRKRYGTKLQKEIAYYVDLLMQQLGPQASILDLGCGSGGNKEFLSSVGFENVVSVDYLSAGAEFLVDVHRLPFSANSFDMILTTATLEHFYNPYIAFSEMARVLKTQGTLLASGSFWESWHGDSCFHFSPGAMDLLCGFAGLKLCDMWSGWGFIPSVCSHALGLSRFKRQTYALQRLFDYVLSRKAGAGAAKRHRFRTSGSFGILAKKCVS